MHDGSPLQILRRAVTPDQEPVAAGSAASAPPPSPPNDPAEHSTHKDSATLRSPDVQQDQQRSGPDEQQAQQRSSNGTQRAFGRSPNLRPVCQGSTVAGEACRSFARGGSDYCVAHDPEYAEEMAAARLAGGQARVERLKRFEDASLGTVEQLRDFNAEVVRAAVSGDITPQALQAIREAIVIQQRLIRDAFDERKYGHP
jgi:hypothetical protein